MFLGIQGVLKNSLISIVGKLCFDSKVDDDPKRVSYQLISSKVNIFLLSVDLCIYSGVYYIVEHVYLCI